MRMRTRTSHVIPMCAHAYFRIVALTKLRRRSALRRGRPRCSGKAMLSDKPLLQLCRLALLICAVVSPSQRSSVHAQSPPAEPSSAPPSQAICTTGPAMTESNSIFVNGRQFISDSGEVSCDGFITAWRFCHYVIGFRHLEMAIWAGVWRLEGDNYHQVGLNIIVVQPPGYDEERLRCVDHKVDAFDWIETKAGDYIGFYLPENGVFVASASPVMDPDHQQLQLIEYGYAETFNASQVEVAASSTGRALLGADIDPNAEKPSPTSPPFTITPSPFPSPSQPGTGATVGATASETRGGDSGSITEIVVPAVAGVVIVALVVIIVVLVVYLRRHRTVEATVRPLTLPLPRAVDATNPTTGTTDNGSVLYEAVYSQAYLQARDAAVSTGKKEAGYSMISNPAYLKGQTLTRGNSHNQDDSGEATPTVSSPPVINPTYGATLPSTGRQNGNASTFVRYPKVVFRQKRPLTNPASPPPTIPAPECPAPPPPPLPYALCLASSRPPPLTLKNPHTSGSGSPLSPPSSPYCNPYKSPRPRSPDSVYEPIVPPIILPQIMSGSSTMTRESDQSTMTRESDRSSGDTQSTYASSPIGTEDKTETDQNSK